MNYTITVATDNGTIVAGEGNRKVLFYLANEGQNALEALGDAVEATVSIFRGDEKILNVTIDAESAAGLLKARILKIRRADAATPAEATA